jgi:hypothetical protein
MQIAASNSGWGQFFSVRSMAAWYLEIRDFREINV